MNFIILTMLAMNAARCLLRFMAKPVMYYICSVSISSVDSRGLSSSQQSQNNILGRISKLALQASWNNFR